jgi:hypothetical protein
MIAEKFPELKTLPPEEQLELASELAMVALRCQKAPDLSPKAIELMEKRLDYFLAHPDTGMSWEDLRAQKHA